MKKKIIMLWLVSRGWVLGKQLRNGWVKLIGILVFDDSGTLCTFEPSHQSLQQTRGCAQTTRTIFQKDTQTAIIQSM